MKFKGTGILRYDPYRWDMKGNTDWWLVLNTDPEIVRYYAKQVVDNPTVFDETYIDLINPSWGSHISVVRGEQPRGKLTKLWKKYNGDKIEFEYSHIVRRSGDTTSGFLANQFWFIEVWCDRLHKIRSELGLPIQSREGRPYTYHITVGRTR